MADQVRSLPELIADFPTNTTGKIRASYVRDLATTVFGYRTTVDPTADNDSVDSAGLGVKFSIGSTWTNTNLQTHWICVDDRPGIALWLDVQSSADISALVTALHAYSDAAAAAAESAAESYADAADAATLTTAEAYSDSVGSTVLGMVPGIVVSTITVSSGGSKIHATWYDFGAGAGQVCQGNDTRLS